MDVTASLEAQVEPAPLFEVVSDLATYPRWLDIVPRAEPMDMDHTGAAAWSVDIRGQLGPLRRSKRLRMLRTHIDADRRVVFERRELGDTTHSDWRLVASLEPVHGTDGVTGLTMELHYGGSLWMPMLDRLLADEIERSRSALLDVLGAAR